MHTVILFYKYTPIANPADVCKNQRYICNDLAIKGRIILASEGINGTLSGTDTAINHYITQLCSIIPLSEDDFKKSVTPVNCFDRLSVMTKPTIVNMGPCDAQVTLNNTGTHLSPAQMHHALQNNSKDLLIFDARNNFESRIGAFQGAYKPDIDHFRDLPSYIDDNSSIFKDKDVIMYCTGGIRCEKASAYLAQKKIARSVSQLDGGICHYVKQFPHGFFKGKNYVFDARVALAVTDDVCTTCDLCPAQCDEYTHCLRASCNKQYIACDNCRSHYKNSCSTTCYQALYTYGESQRSPFIKVTM